MIEVGRNSIVIRNVDLESKEFKTLRYNLSTWDKATFKYTFSAFTVIDKDIYIPASFTVDAVQRIFLNKSIVTNYKTTAKSTNIKYKIKNPPRDEIQRKAISFLSGMINDYDKRERFLSLATGKGKTYVTINILSKIGKKAMVIVDTLDLATQWKNEFLNHSDLKDDDIFILSGSESVENEIKDKSAKIYIGMHRTLGNLLNEDANSINNLMNKLGIGVRVFDEAHVEFNNICRINSLSNVEYTLYLTATPSRSNFSDNSIYANIFKSIPYFNGKDIDNQKYHKVIIYPFNSQPPFEVQAAVKTAHGFNMGRWSNYLEGDGYDSFIESLENLIVRFKFKERDKKVAVMLPSIELIKKTKTSISHLYNENEIGMFIGEIKKADRLKELEKPIFLTNPKIFDKAIDVPNLEVLINYASYSSNVKIEQIIGRLRNRPGKSSIFIDAADVGFKEIREHLKIRKRFYKKHAKEITEMED